MTTFRRLLLASTLLPLAACGPADEKKDDDKQLDPNAPAAACSTQEWSFVSQAIIGDLDATGTYEVKGGALHLTSGVKDGIMSNAVVRRGPFTGDFSFTVTFDTLSLPDTGATLALRVRDSESNAASSLVRHTGDALQIAFDALKENVPVIEDNKAQDAAPGTAGRLVLSRTGSTVTGTTTLGNDTITGTSELGDAPLWLDLGVHVSSAELQTVSARIDDVKGTGAAAFHDTFDCDPVKAD